MKRNSGQVLYTTNSSAQRTSFNLYGDDDVIIASKRYGGGQAGKFLTYTTDTRNSTSSVLADDGTELISYTYSDFGETTRTGDDTTYNEIAYIGGIYDESTQLYYLNARYYDPADARFLTRDPARDAATNGLYTYCKGDPIDGTDPSGEITSWGRRPAIYPTAQPSSSSAHPTVRRGSRGAAVKTLQQRLNALGYGWLTVDGIFGAHTDSAVRTFQRKHRGLAVDGIVGPKTWAALQGKQYTYLTGTNYANPSGHWAEKMSGFAWRNPVKVKGKTLYTSFSVTTTHQFLSKSFCWSFAADIRKSPLYNPASRLSQKDLAAECFFHGVAHYATIISTSVFNRGHSWYTSAKTIDIDPGDPRTSTFLRVWNYSYLIGYWL